MEKSKENKISEKEKEAIRKKAETILNDFSKQLEKIPESKLEEPQIKRKFWQREEKAENKSNSKKETCQEIDKKTMFANAPHSEDDFIIAEKGGWN